MTQVTGELVFHTYVGLCRDCKPSWNVKGFTGNRENLTATEAEMAVMDHVRTTGHTVDTIGRQEVKWSTSTKTTQSGKSTP